VCHGVPDGTRSAIADGLFPKPPQLFKGTGVTDDDAWESYWKAADGIRLTGMPGFKAHLSDIELWQVAVLVKNADKISPAVKTELVGAAPPASQPAAISKKN
jgi:thiosulfate dehydrogenase